MSLPKYKLVVVCLISFLVLTGCKIKTIHVQNENNKNVVIPIAKPKVSTNEITNSKRNLIICPSEFKRGAEFFKYLHQEYESVGSDILLVKVSNSTNSAQTDITDALIKVTNKKSASNKYSSILILADESRIPVPVFEIGDKKVKSDFAFAGLAEGIENYMVVGRIPAKTDDQVYKVAQKYDRWYQTRRFQPSLPVSFVGGDKFQKDIYSDPELLFFNLQQEGIAGAEAIRYLGGFDGCKRSLVLNSLKNDDTSIQWFVTPFTTKGIKIGNDILPDSELCNLKFKSGLPVILNPLMEKNSETGASIVLSDGGGLGYLGTNSLKTSLKSELSKGKIYRVDMEGGARFLLDFHRAYFSGKRNIGEAIKEARGQFSQAKDNGDLTVLYTMKIYADPVMTLNPPVRTESPSYSGLSLLTKCKSDKSGLTFPVNATVSFAMEEGGIYPAVSVEVVDIDLNEKVASIDVAEDEIVNFSSDGVGRYILYSRPLDGPLAWQFINIGEVNTKLSNTKESLKNDIKIGVEPIKYSVQVSSNRLKKSAVNVAKKLSKKGYSSYVVRVKRGGSGYWYCVRFGDYKSWPEAVEASAAYEKKTQADVQIVKRIK